MSGHRKKAGTRNIGAEWEEKPFCEAGVVAKARRIFKMISRVARVLTPEFASRKDSMENSILRIDREDRCEEILEWDLRTEI